MAQLSAQREASRQQAASQQMCFLVVIDTQHDLHVPLCMRVLQHVVTAFVPAFTRTCMP